MGGSRSSARRPRSIATRQPDGRRRCFPTRRSIPRRSPRRGDRSRSWTSSVGWTLTGAAAGLGRRRLHGGDPPELRPAAPRPRPRPRADDRQGADHRAVRLGIERAFRASGPNNWVSLAHGVHPYRGRRRSRSSSWTRPSASTSRPTALSWPEGGRHGQDHALATCATATCADPNGPGRLRAEGNRPRLGRRRRLCAARAVRLRQIDPAQHHLRPACSRPRGGSCSTART